MSNFTLKEIDFRLPNVKGGELSMSDFPQAKAIVLVFTCNHCPYAIAYEDRLILLSKKYQPQGIPFIAISSNDAVQYPQDSFERMKERAKDKGFPFPYLYDESQEVAKRLGASRTPHAFVLVPQKEGMWQLLYSGAIDDNYKNEQLVNKSYLSDVLDRLLEEGTFPAWHTDAVGCTIKWRM